MVDFNGFDKGVVGKKLPADTTLVCMKKSELIKLLHLAEDNHRVLAEAYKIAVDTSKCNMCPLGLDKRRADEIRADAIDEFINLVKADYEFKVDNINYTDDIVKHLRFIAEQMKEQKNERTTDTPT